MGQEAKLKEATHTKLLAEYEKMSKDLNRFADFSICLIINYCEYVFLIINKNVFSLTLLKDLRTRDV